MLSTIEKDVEIVVCFEILFFKDVNWANFLFPVKLKLKFQKLMDFLCNSYVCRKLNAVSVQLHDFQNLIGFISQSWFKQIFKESYKCSAHAYRKFGFLLWPIYKCIYNQYNSIYRTLRYLCMDIFHANLHIIIPCSIECNEYINKNVESRT